MRNVHRRTQETSAWQNHSACPCLLLLDSDLFSKSETNSKKKTNHNTYSATVQHRRTSALAATKPHNCTQAQPVTPQFETLLVWYRSDFISNIKLHCEISQNLAEKITMFFSS